MRAAVLLLLILLPCSALAGDSSFYGEVFNNLLESYLDEFDDFREDISEAATRLFWIMCSISLVMSGVGLVFKGDDIQSFFAFMVRYVLIIGVFLFLIENNYKISSAILDSALTIGWPTSTATQTPTEILFTTSDISQMLFNKITFTLLSPVVGFVMGIALLIFTVVMFFCVIRFTTIFVTGYILCVVGVISVGFAPYVQTRYIAVNYVRSLVATGLRLFTSAMIIQCSHNFLYSLNTEIENRGKIEDFRDVYAVLFVAFFTYALMRVVPDEIASIVLSPGGSQGSDIGAGRALKSGSRVTLKIASGISNALTRGK